MKNQSSINKIFNFKNKIIVISGTSGQLGSSFAELFLSNGSIVVGIDKKKIKLKIKISSFLKLIFQIQKK